MPGRFRDGCTVRPGNRPVVAIVHDEERSLEARDEPVRRELLPVDPQPLGEPLTHELAHMARKAEHLAHFHREVDDILRWGDHDHPFGNETMPRRQRHGRRPERMSQNRTQRSDGSAHLEHGARIVHHVRAGAIRLSVGGSVEGHNSEASLDERIHEHGQAGGDAAPAVK